MDQPTPPPSLNAPRWWLSAAANRWQQWAHQQNAGLEGLADLLLGVTLAVQWTTDNQSISAGMGTLWLLLRLAISRSPSAPGHWVLILILLLNLRGLVFQEGTQPASHMDYIIILSAFVGGLGRKLAHWQQSVLAISAGGAIGLLLNANPLLASLQAIANGTAATTNWPGQLWAGHYFRAGELSVNQTALLGGASLCACVPMAVRAKGATRVLLLLASGLLGLAVVATGSRMALVFPPLLCAGSLWWTRRHDVAPRCRRRPMALLAILMISLFSAILFTTAGPQAWHAYVGRKLAGDLDRLKVLACYGQLPFSGDSRWLYGVGYGEARIRFCDHDVGITVSHAHNFFAQIMAESGLLSTIVVTAAAIAICGRLMVWLRPQRGSTRIDQTQLTTIGAALLASSLYLFAFNLFELGLLKVTVLELLFGYIPAAAFWMPSTPSNNTVINHSAANH